MLLVSSTYEKLWDAKTERYTKDSNLSLIPWLYELSIPLTEWSAATNINNMESLELVLFKMSRTHLNNAFIFSFASVNQLAELQILFRFQHSYAVRLKYCFNWNFRIHMTRKNFMFNGCDLTNFIYLTYDFSLSKKYKNHFSFVTSYNNRRIF